MEGCLLAQEWLELSHYITDMSIARYLVTQTEPGLDVGRRCRCRGIPDSIQIFQEWLNRSVVYAESGKVYDTLCELEFVRIEDYPCSAEENEVFGLTLKYSCFAQLGNEQQCINNSLCTPL